MKRFKVKLFSRGLWRKEDYVNVEAPDPRTAAEYLAGANLVDQGPPGRLVALVRSELFNADSTAIAFYAAA